MRLQFNGYDYGHSTAVQTQQRNQGINLNDNRFSVEFMVSNFVMEKLKKFIFRPNVHVRFHTTM